MRGAFVALGCHGTTGEDELAGLLVGENIEGLAIQHLKLDEVDVQGMDVGGGVDESPDLGAAGLWIFGDGFVPACISQEAGNDVAVRWALFLRHQKESLACVVGWAEWLEGHERLWHVA